MDVPSFWRLINTEKIEDLPLWGTITNQDMDEDNSSEAYSEASDSLSSDSGYDADDESDDTDVE